MEYVVFSGFGTIEEWYEGFSLHRWPGLARRSVFHNNAAWRVSDWKGLSSDIDDNIK
jgi:hypothetical protein